MKCNKDCFNCSHPDCINDDFDKNRSEHNGRYAISHKEQISERKKRRYHELKAKGICVHCGTRKALKGKVACVECRNRKNYKAVERSRKKGVMPRTWYDGTERCRRCGKHAPVHGYKLCAECLESARRCIKEANGKG